MEKKIRRHLSWSSLLVSVLPLATFIPVLLKISLSAEIRLLWAGANIAFVLAGLGLSLFCVCKKESRSVVNIVACALSIFWASIMAGIVALALFLTFFQ